MMQASLWQPVALSGAVQQAPLPVQLLERDLALWPCAEMRAAADQASMAYRRFLQASGTTFGVC